MPLHHMEDSNDETPRLLQMASILAPGGHHSQLQRKRWLRKWVRAKAKLMRAIREGQKDIGEVGDEAYAGPRVSKSDYFVRKMQHAQSHERLAILERVRESYTRIKTVGGVLEMRPIQALNLNQVDRHVFLNVRYGPTTGVRSAPSIPGVVHRWSRDHGIGAETPTSPLRYRRDHRFPDTVRIQVEESMNKSLGTLQLGIYAEHVASLVEIGRVELPIMNVLECLSVREEYVKWFPLAPAGDCVHFEGDDGEDWWILGSEESQPTRYQDRMCIQLALRWEPFRARNLGPTKYYVCAVLGGVSVTLSKSKPATGLLQATVSDVELVVEESSKRTRLATSANWIQIDNQLPSCNEMVVLAPTLVDSLQPVFQLRVSRNNASSHGNFLSLKYITVMLQELDIRIDQGLLLELWHFVGENWRKLFGSPIRDRNASSPGSRVVHARATDGTEALPASSTTRRSAARHRSSARGSKVYIEQLCLFPVKVNLTIGRGSDSSTVERHFAVGDNYLQNFHGLALQAFIKLLADFLLSVSATLNGAPIKLNALFVWHIFNTPEHIASSLREHYVSSLLRQLYRVVASLDYIGNPMSLVNSLGTGFHDFFFEPVEGFFLGPSAFALGAMRGTLSLVGNATSGILSTAARVTSTVGRIVAYPVLDADYNRWRSKQRQRGRRSHVQPLIDVGSGFVRGITGIVQDPYRGAKRDGAKGFVLGCLKGVVGVGVKPIVGIIDAYAHATENLQKFATHLNSDRRLAVRRLRFAPMFGLDSRLLPYDFATALSHATLREHPLEKRRSRLHFHVDVPEVVVWAEVLGGPEAGKLLFVTPHRVICAKVRRDHGLVQTELEWAALLSDDGVSVEAHLKDTGSMGGLELYISRRPKMKTGQSAGSPMRDGHPRARGPGGGNDLPFNRGSRWLGLDFDYDGSSHMLTVHHADRRSVRCMHAAVTAVVSSMVEPEVDEANGAGSAQHELAASGPVVAFGDWRFGPGTVDSTLIHMAGIDGVLEDLSLVNWHVTEPQSGLLSRRATIRMTVLGQPMELHPLFERAKDRHKVARDLTTKARRDPRDSDRIALLKKKLNDNVISGSEFEQCVEAEEQVSKAPQLSEPLRPPLIRNGSSTMSMFSLPPANTSTQRRISRSLSRPTGSGAFQAAPAKEVGPRKFKRPALRLPFSRSLFQMRSVKLPPGRITAYTPEGDESGLSRGELRHTKSEVSPTPVPRRDAGGQGAQRPAVTNRALTLWRPATAARPASPERVADGDDDSSATCSTTRSQDRANSPRVVSPISPPGGAELS